MARDIFLDVLGVDAVILPRIVALGGIDEDELAFTQAVSLSPVALELPPALDGLARIHLDRRLPQFRGAVRSRRD